MASLIGFALAVVLSTPLSIANECWVNKQGLKYAEGYDKDVVPENTEVTLVSVDPHPIPGELCSSFSPEFDQNYL